MHNAAISALKITYISPVKPEDLQAAIAGFAAVDLGL